MQTGSSSTKVLLMVLADIADNEGHMRFISVKYLCECSELSRSTVFTHLRRLENGGVFERETSHRRDDGAPVVTGRLLIGRFFRDGEAVEGGVREPDSGGAVQLPDWGESGSRTGGSPAAGLAPYSNNTRVNNTGFNNTSPSTSDSGVATPDGDAGGGGAGDGLGEGMRGEGGGERGRPATFDDLLAAYPWDSTMDRAAAEREFERLALRERALAVRAARIYAGDLRRRGRSHARDLARWLADRAFDDIQRVAQVKAQGSGLATPRVFVMRGGEPWEAWGRRWRAEGKVWPPTPYTYRDHQGCDPRMVGKIGWFFPSLWPPSQGATGPPDAA
jgi:hypothetical protein